MEVGAPGASSVFSQPAVLTVAMPGVQQSGMTLGGSGLTFDSIDFGDSRGVIPLSRLTPTHAIPTTEGGPGIIPELGSGDPEQLGSGGHRRIFAGAGATQDDALNITGDANFGTIYQAGGVDGLDKTLDLFFAQPITTTTNTDVLMVEHWWGGVNLNGATVSGIDMSGNLVGSVTVLGSGQDMGRSGNRPGLYTRLDVDGNPVTVIGQSGRIDGPARAWGFNFDAGLQLQGVRLAWNNGGLQYLGEVWGVADIPPSISFTDSAGQLTLSWTGTGYHVQANPVVNNSGGWTNVPGGNHQPVDSSHTSDGEHVLPPDQALSGAHAGQSEVSLTTGEAKAQALASPTIVPKGNTL